MSINQQMIEDLAAWCMNSVELAAERKAARRVFFGDDDPRPVNYIEGAEDRISRDRRFAGWFMLDFVLPNGEKPAAVAAKRIVSGHLQAEALKAVMQARFVLAVVTSVFERSVYLELEEEDFEVRSSVWAANVSRDQAIAAHIVPDRRRYWIPAPGWLVWPVGLGPGIRSALKRWQIDPVGAERFLQQRLGDFDGKRRPDFPEDDNLVDAVSRMTKWANETGHECLVLSVDEWQSLVVRYLNDPQITAFSKDVFDRLGPAQSQDEVNQALALATNIWNNTPQPDRGGKSANQIARR